MSGIVGIYRLDGRPADRTDAERMEKTLAHRGPDGSGVWTEGPVALGHRMLWTTPESLHEKLPLTNKTGNLVLTADARIDNRDELIATLGLNGRPQNEIADSELILAAYEEWYEHCPEKLLGDFAFAIWDGRRQELFCARDHFGVKPFYYYHHSGRTFIFASEIKALLCLPEVPRRLNETRVADYLVPMLEDKEITFYQNILRLPPAHTMTISREGLSMHPYWALDPSRELRLGSDEEYAEAFRKIFTDAVRCRLRSAFPIGSMLSGGLDSSSIVCVARKLLAGNGNHRLHTFSATFDDLPQCDERPFITAVLAQGKLAPHYVRVDRLNPLADINRVIWQQDEPFYGPNLFIHRALFNAAQEQEIRVLLDGFDGDTTVSHGIAYLTQLARAWRWSALATEVAGLSRNLNISPWRILWQRVIKPLAPEPVRKVRRLLCKGNQVSWDAMINANFARRIGLADRVLALQGNHSKPLRTSREDHYHRLMWGLIPYALEVADRAAVSFSIEPRFPFFDRRVVEFCLALPPEQKLSQGWTRVVMRRAMADILPTKVQWRGGKSDISPVHTNGLLTIERRLEEAVILSDPKIIQEYVDIAAVDAAYRRGVSRSTQEDVLTVWKAVTLILWLRQTCLNT